MPARTLSRCTCTSFVMHAVRLLCLLCRSFWVKVSELRLSPRRLTILFGHTPDLPANMVIQAGSSGTTSPQRSFRSTTSRTSKHEQAQSGTPCKLLSLMASSRQQEAIVNR